VACTVPTLLSDGCDEMTQQIPTGPILVVDDEPPVRSLCAEILADEGYAVLLARDGREALILARSQPPALILMDIMMPGLDGLAACYALQADVDTPATFPASSCRHSAMRARAATSACAAAAILPKPFDLENLLSTVHKLAF
jgi:CheY-like chemotaxis protein